MQKQSVVVSRLIPAPDGRPSALRGQRWYSGHTFISSSPTLFAQNPREDPQFQNTSCVSHRMEHFTLSLLVPPHPFTLEELLSVPSPPHPPPPLRGSPLPAHSSQSLRSWALCGIKLSNCVSDLSESCLETALPSWALPFLTRTMSSSHSTVSGIYCLLPFSECLIQTFK